MIERPLYLNKIRPFINRDFIKILVGIRRAGKSSLLSQIKTDLIKQGVPARQITYINFDSLEYAEIRTRHDFLELVKSLKKSGVKYYFFDEVQLVDGWDEIVSALYAEKTADIYISGSNSKLLSSELSTFLTGRYINTRISTLNFSEFIDFWKARNGKRLDTSELFKEYMMRGGFPVINAAEDTYEQGDLIVSDIYSSIVLNDIIQRKKVRNTELLSRVVKFIFDNIGNTFSANSIVDFLKNEKRIIAPETIYNYLDWLSEAFIVEKVSRYDIRGKTILKTQEKYYLGDIGLLYALNGRKDSYKNGILENIVYLELISKGYEVYIGKNQDKEIDFIAEKQGQKIYLQIALEATSKNAKEREFDAFEGIDDNYPKYVLTLEQGPGDEQNGIIKKYLPDFLLSL